MPHAHPFVLIQCNDVPCSLRNKATIKQDVQAAIMIDKHPNYLILNKNKNKKKINTESTAQNFWWQTGQSRQIGGERDGGLR